MTSTQTMTTWPTSAPVRCCTLERDYYDMYEESKAYCRKHIAHVYGKGQDINIDKLMESLGDIVVYSLIQMYMVEKHYMVCREMLEE